MNGWVAIQLFDPRKQFRLRRHCRELELHGMQTELAAHFIFRANVGARRRIIAHENDGKARCNSFRFYFRDLAAKIDVNFFGNRAAVDQVCHTVKLVMLSEAKHLSSKREASHPKRIFRSAQDDAVSFRSQRSGLPCAERRLLSVVQPATSSRFENAIA